MPRSGPVFELIPEATAEPRNEPSPWFRATMRMVRDLERACRLAESQLWAEDRLDREETARKAKTVLYLQLRSRDEAFEALAWSNRDRA